MDLQVTAARLTGNAQEDIKRLSDYVFQLEENMRYLLRNLDVTNFNDLGLARYENGRLQVYTEALEVKAEELKVQLGAETDEIYAMISATAEELIAEIETVDGKYAGLKLTVDGLQSTVSSQDTMIKNGYATLQSQITQQANAISLVVDSDKNVTPASIVAAINEAGSEVKIEAEHIALTGVVTVSDLAGTGTVEINAGNIAAGGTIEGVTIKSSGRGFDDVEISGAKIYVGSGELYSEDGNTYLVEYGKLYVGTANELSLEGDVVKILVGNRGYYWEFTSGGIYWCDPDGHALNQVMLTS